MSDPSQYYEDGSSSRSYHGWNNEPHTSHQHIQSEADERCEAETAAGPSEFVPCATAPKPKRLKIGPWDESEIQELIRLKEEGKYYKDIGPMIGRTESQCNSKYGNIMRDLSLKRKLAQTNGHGGNVSTDTGSATGAQPISAQQQQQPSSSSKTSQSSVYVPEGMKGGPIFYSPLKDFCPWRPDPEGDIQWDVFGLKELIKDHGPRIDRAVYYGCDEKKAWDVVVDQCRRKLKLKVEREELRQCWERIKEEWSHRPKDAGGESHGT